MSWTLLVALVFGPLLAVLVLRVRRAELERSEHGVQERAEAKQRGSHQARLQHPFIDLTRCIGCETCVKACPEDGVLELIHGQASVVHGARCVGHGRCADACPVGAVALTLGDISERRDLPVLTPEWESTRVPGLFLAGEVTGYALIRTAVEHGRSIADVVAGRRDAAGTSDPGEADVLDLCVVGAGPAGLSCSLEAKARGLSFETLEQASFGGTVASYPRRKLVMTQPVELPLHGRLDKSTYSKEELMELWSDVAREHALPIRTNVQLLGVEARAGHLAVNTSEGEVKARNVCLALGRRGTPRKLGVPGEELPKVAYSLLDAQSYSGRRILVVGGGDSAIEAALGLSEQPGNTVTLSYRKPAFSRLKARNDARIQAAMERGDLDVRFESQVAGITADAVLLKLADGTVASLANDEVFVMAGGIPPFELLQDCGVSFDPADRPAAAPLAEAGTGLLRALTVASLLALACAAWVFAHADYYLLPGTQRFDSPWHERLRPSSPLGLALGLAAALLILLNLSYLVRRSSWGQRLPGSLKLWMSSHVVSGLLAGLFVVLHAAMAPRNTVGGQAFAALAVLIVTGAVGRYLYSFVPRAANGRELQLEEVRARLTNFSREWDEHGRGLDPELRAELEAFVGHRTWSAGFLARLGALLTGQRRLRAMLRRLQRSAREHDVPQERVKRLAVLARKAHRTSLMASHFEDVRALLSSWRFLHRWVALLMVVLATWHVIVALRYGEVLAR